MGNELAANGDKRMTVQEVADALGVSPRTVQRHATARGTTRNGIATYLTEDDAMEIKKAIERSGRNDLDNVVEVANITTDLEMKQKTAEVMAWLASQIATKDAKIEVLEPKAAFYDQVAGCNDAIDMGEAAKVLNMKIGRNTMFERLRTLGILMPSNQPYQQYIDAGYFRVIETKYELPNGETRINIKTVVYQRGLDYIRKRLTLDAMGKR